MTHTTDVAVRGLSKNGHVRALACVTTRLVNELQRRHQTWPVATAALGRTASIAAMMGLMMKGEERLTIQIKGDGPLGSVVVDADSTGHVRGYVTNPQVHLPPNALGKLDVGGAVGQGMLYVMRDMGLKDVYRGSVELQTGEIADDFTHYFATSEQTPSAVGAGVLVDTDNRAIVSGGFIVQLVPGYTEDDLSELESHLAEVKSVTDCLKSDIGAVELLRIIVPDVQVSETQLVEFQCTCSRHRMKVLMAGLGRTEVESLLEDQGEAELICHFCNQDYQFSRGDLEAILNELPSERA